MTKVFILFYCVFVYTSVTDAGGLPEFGDINVPINVNEDVITETSLDVFNVTDPDGGVVTSCTLTGHKGEFFLIQDATNNALFDLVLSSGAGLEYDNTPTFTLTVSCEDDQDDIGNETIVVNVLPNEPPTIAAQVPPVNIGENEVGQRVIYTINVTDVENNDVTCDIQNVVPTFDDFGCWRAFTDFEIYLLAGASLSYTAVPGYNITYTCWDSFGSSTAFILVDVIPNAPPRFSNLPASPILVDADSRLLGEIIFTAEAYDNDSSSLTFTMTSNPTTPDLFEIDNVLGEIRTTKDLTYAVDSGYSFAITVSDGKASTTETLIVNLTNVNNAPIINNLPDTIYVDENKPVNTVLLLLDKYDADGDRTTLTYTVLPTQNAADIYLSNSTVGGPEALDHVRIGVSFDYETCSKYVVSFFISDGLAETGPHYLTINVNDVNEQCVFDNNLYYITMYEGNAGTGTSAPGYIVTDEDVGDTATFSINQAYSTESSYFDINPTTGDISFALNYDVDGVHPKNATLIVVCTDTRGETGTATVEVEVLDVNDNVPLFTRTGYIDYIDQTSGPATTIRTLNMYCTDLDSGLNAMIEYTWTAVTPGSERYFHLTARGFILLTVYARDHMTYGDVHRFIVTATDKGTPPLHSTVVQDIMYRYVNYSITTTTTTEAPESEGFWDMWENILMVVLGALLGLLLLALLAYLIYRYCCKGNSRCCHRSPKKVKPSEKPNPDKNKFDFWHRKNREENVVQDDGLYGDSKIGGVIRSGGMPNPNV